MNKKILIALLVILVTLATLFWINQNGKTQETSKIMKIGIITLSNVDLRTVSGFKKQMAHDGWSEEKNVHYIFNGPAGSIEKLDSQVDLLLKEEVDMILVSSTPGTLAVKKATQNNPIPVVFAPVNDPVASGIVPSLQHPQGHITGIKLPSGDRQRLQWLHRIAPAVKTVLVPYTPDDQSSEISRAHAKEIARTLGIRMVEKVLRREENIPHLIDIMAKKIDAIFLPRDSSVGSYINTFVNYAEKLQIPLCAPSYLQVEKGALMAYGFAHEEIGKQAAELANKILSGMKPQYLPVEVAHNHLILNAKAAEAIGLKFSDETLKQAYKIIQ